MRCKQRERRGEDRGQAGTEEAWRIERGETEKRQEKRCPAPTALASSLVSTVTKAKVCVVCVVCVQCGGGRRRVVCVKVVGGGRHGGSSCVCVKYIQYHYKIKYKIFTIDKVGKGCEWEEKRGKAEQVQCSRQQRQ